VIVNRRFRDAYCLYYQGPKGCHLHTCRHEYQSIAFNLIFLRTISILSYLGLGHSSGLLPSNFLNKILRAFLIYSIRAVCSFHLFLPLNLIILTISVEECNYEDPYYATFYSFPSNSTLLHPNILLRTNHFLRHPQISILPLTWELILIDSNPGDFKLLSPEYRSLALTSYEFGKTP
jgi:hypothetical protein